MSRLLAAAIALPALCLGLAAQAVAKVDPANSEAPDLITLVACGPGGGADPLGSFTVIVRDWNRIPSEGEDVVLDFRACTGIQICADQRDPNVRLDCSGRALHALTDPDGKATFRVIGCANNHGASPGSIGPSLDVFMNGIYLKTVRVAALDQDGARGVDGVDFTLFLADYFSGQAFARSDYDGNGVIDGNDLSLWLQAFFDGGSAVSGGSACP